MALERETLGFWERLMKFKEKHGYWNLTKLVLFVAFSVAILFLAKNFGESYTFERQKEVVTEVLKENNIQQFKEHEVRMEQRRNIRPLVIGLLKATIDQTGAGRAFVIELHNGSNNTAGLPFIHASMTYEVVRQGIDAVDEDYQNISLTRYTFSEYLHKHDLWFGTIDEFENFDPKMASRMKVNDSKYLVISTIRSDANEIGYFGFIYYDTKDHTCDKKTMEFMLYAVQKLSKWLDKDSITI